MALIADNSVKIFDSSSISRGDCIRFKRANDAYFRNGIVTRVTERTIEVLYGNIQNNQTSYLQILAADVVNAVWELYWTTDFLTINHEGGAGGDGGA